MLSADVERYIALRQKLGFKLLLTSRHLRAFARFAASEGDIYVRRTTAVAWAMGATTPGMRYCRLADVVRLARFLQAEDPAHEVPPTGLFLAHKTRPAPYIYTLDEVARILEAAGNLSWHGPGVQWRRHVYVTLFGLIAATGLRVSEAINLTFDDLLPGGVLRISGTKFGKTRFVPLHETVAVAFTRYLDVRRKVATTDSHIFLSVRRKRLGYTALNSAFRRTLWLAGVAPGRTRPPRIHDLRHTFATRVLEQCTSRPEAVARHFVALSTYMGHADAAHTYWYFQAAPELMAHIAAAGEALVIGGLP